MSHPHHHHQQQQYPQGQYPPQGVAFYPQGNVAYPPGSQANQHYGNQYQHQAYPQATMVSSTNQPYSPTGAAGGDFFILKTDGSNNDVQDRRAVMDSIVIQGEPFLKFFRKDGFQDIFWAILFLISFIGCVIVAIVNGTNGKIDFSGGANSTSYTVNGDTIPVSLLKGLGLGTAISLGLGITLLFLMRSFPEGFIWVANVLVVLLFVGLAILMFFLGSVVGGIIFIIIAIITALTIWCYRTRIKLSGLMLSASTHVILNQFGTVGFAMLVLVISIGWYFAWLMMVVPSITDLQNGNNTSAAGGVMIVFAFMYYWNCETIKNVAHVTSAGTMGTWYFVGEAVFDIGASIPAFTRAVTTSFGSSALAGALVAFLETLEFIVRSQKNNRNAILQCIILCFLDCLQSLLRYFNRLALTFVALFGTPYLQSASLTFEFVRSGSIFGTLVNDILLGRVFLMANLAQAAIVAVVCWFAFENWLSVIGGILCAILVGGTLFNTVDSASVTLMVCVSLFPEVFVAQHPQLRGQLIAAIQELQSSGNCCDGDDDQNI